MATSRKGLPSLSRLRALRVLVLMSFLSSDVSSLKLETLFSSCRTLEYVDVEITNMDYVRHVRPPSGRFGINQTGEVP